MGRCRETCCGRLREDSALKDESIGKRTERDIALDMLKGLCILLVVYGHLPRVGYLHEQLETVVQFIYTFHMPVFVLLSGFLFARHPSNVTKVFNRVIKPYVVVAMVYIPLLYFSARHSGASILEMLVRIFVGHGGGALWYLYDLAVVELLAIAGLVVLRKFKKICDNPVFVCVAAAVSVCLGCMFLNLNGGKIVRLFPMWFCMYFSIGFIIGQFHSEIPASICGALGIAISLSFLRVDRGLPGNYLWVLSLVVLLVYCLRKINDARIGKGLAWLGRHTLAILLFHPIFNHVVNALFVHLLKLEGSGIMVGMVSLAVNVGLCLSLEAGIRKIPLSKIIF